MASDATASSCSSAAGEPSPPGTRPESCCQAAYGARFCQAPSCYTATSLSTRLSATMIRNRVESSFKGSRRIGAFSCFASVFIGR